MPDIHITEFAKAAGCAAKIGPGDLHDILSGLPVRSSPDLLLGFEDSDDAGIFRLTDDIALVQTVDFFTPIVDDPYTFGQVAAANALSDVYAMGGKPLTALNLIAFPIATLDKSVLKAIVAGGLDKINESGAVLCGGHSIKDQEIKYGVSVTGRVHPDKFWANRHARVGDTILLTKRIGTGILTTAIKQKLAGPEVEKRVAASMIRLNDKAADIAAGFNIRACTDVTGFGLFGHLLEVAIASRVCVEIDTATVPLFEGVQDYFARGAYPGGGKANFNYCECRLMAKQGRTIERSTLDIMLDPQTSGGLLLFVREKDKQALLHQLHSSGIEDAADIGRVTDGPAGKLIYF
ncbi:MAG: selenide, water dikinase SelD [Elusimicrobia bacterium RIFOXYB2_FULL_49_7]|nr:MAG: selenide, water dikinase SelD [Elusimicrobia bacterium RIFOXYB2_FULL_49_7]